MIFHLFKYYKFVYLRAESKVIVLPDPGGPQSTSGLRSLSHVFNSDSWRTVSIVGITKEVSVILCASISICGTLDIQGIQSPVGVTQ